MGKKGFGHFPDEDSLREYQKLSAAEKLEWLEEINRFLHKAMPRERKKTAADFRAGRI